MPDFYQQKSEEVLSNLNSSPSGLKKDIVPSLQEKYGKNKLKEAQRKSKLSIFLSQFKDVMILILIIAAIISFAVGEHTDAYVILAIIFGNALIGFYQENSAEQSVRMLQQMTAQYALVIRNNNASKVEAGELVPGDIILMESGDIVPADARLLEVSSFKTEEAALTGESHSVEKNTTPIAETGLLPGDQRNMVFKGTIVSNGSAKAVVTSTGMNTEIGKIASLLEAGSPQTPLQKRLSKFSKQLAVIVLVICLVVFGFGLLRGEPPFLMFLTALSLAVAALPEALPAVITIALSQGARRMVMQKALMRKLPAVETLGSVTYICSDKTGTLTQNIMTVEKIQSAPDLEALLKHSMILNNEVRFSEDEGLLGDSTEIALVKYALKEGNLKEASQKAYPLIAKLPFDSIRMRMSTLHQHEDKWILFIKGAPVKILEVLSSKYKEQIPSLQETNRKWAAEGLRVLFFAYKILDKKPDEVSEQLESDLEFLGITAMIDPPREEVIEAIKECKSAGIKSVMITGDQPFTAFAIAERLQLVDEGKKETRTGAELEKMTDEEFNNTVGNTFVFARVSPNKN